MVSSIHGNFGRYPSLVREDYRTGRWATFAGKHNLVFVFTCKSGTHMSFSSNLSRGPGKNTPHHSPAPHHPNLYRIGESKVFVNFNLLSSFSQDYFLYSPLGPSAYLMPLWNFCSLINQGKAILGKECSSSPRQTHRRVTTLHYVIVRIVSFRMLYMIVRIL